VGKTSIITRFVYDKFDCSYQVCSGFVRGVLYPRWVEWQSRVCAQRFPNRRRLSAL